MYVYYEVGVMVMIKKSLALVLAAALLSSQVNANVAVVDSAAAVVQQEEGLNADLVPQTVSQQEFFAEGQAAAVAVLEANPNATAEDVLQAVEAAYGTVALRNQEKVVWMAIGVAATVLAYLGWNLISKTFFSNNDEPAAVAPAAASVREAGLEVDPVAGAEVPRSGKRGSTKK